MIEINGKVYRNIQEQVGENQENIEDLDTRVTALEESPAQTYTEGAGIDILNNVISVDNTIVPFKADLATVATTGSYTDLSNKPNLSIYAEKTEAVTKDENGNVNGVLQVEQLESETWDEDDDCKADIYLSSGLRRSTITLETEGEETGSSIILQGTTSVGSEGIIDLHGETRVFTNSRITVIDGNDDTEQVAYLSDISGGGSSETTIELSVSNISTSAATAVTLSAAQLASYKAAVLAHTPITFVLLTPGGPGAEDTRVYLRPGQYVYTGIPGINSDTAFYGFYYGNVIRLRYINDSTGVGYITTAALTFTSD